MTDKEKIYKLILSANENNFKIAYELLKNIDNFAIKDITDYFIKLYGIKNTSHSCNKISSFYDKLAHNLYAKSLIYYRDDKAMTFYNSILKNLTYDYYESKDLNVVINKIVNENINSVSHLKFCFVIYDKNDEKLLSFELLYLRETVSYNEIYSYKGFRYLLDYNEKDQLDLISTDTLSVIVHKTRILKKAIDKIVDVNLLKLYKESKATETSKYVEYSEFSAKISLLLNADEINKKIKYKRLLQILNVSSYPILFKNYDDEIKIISYNKENNEVECIINGSLFKSYTLQQLFNSKLLPMI